MAPPSGLPAISPSRGEIGKWQTPHLNRNPCNGQGIAPSNLPP